MTDVAFAPTWQRRPPRRFLILAVGFALVILAFASGPRLVLDYRDLTCPDGYGARPFSVAAWAMECRPNDAVATWPRSAPISRYVGLFLTHLDARVFEADLVGGELRGPALNVRATGSLP